MQNQGPKKEVHERALLCDASKNLLIDWVYLLSETGKKHELCNVGAEPGQKGIEGVVAHHKTEQELHHTTAHQVNHKQIDCSDPDGRSLVVLP